MKNIVLLFTLFSSSLLAQNPTREIHLLNNNWDFSYGYEVKANTAQRVNLPHTWNSVDAPNGKNDYFRGEGIYEKKVFIPEKWKGKRLYIKFDGANTVAHFFLNGKHIGEHKGGYTAFVFELTDSVKYNQENDLQVRVSNALNLEVMPLLGDFNFYGGIYRDVHLIVTEKSSISLLDYGSSGIYLAQKNVSKTKADITAKILISNGEKVDKNYDIQLDVFEGAKNILSKSTKITVEAKKQVPAMLSFDLKNPRLWNATKDPFSYKTVISLFQNGQLLDQLEQPLGLRFFNVDADKGVFLNGDYLQLKGVCRHQDRSEVGNALSKADHDEDMNIMLDMGANAIRLSHYPHDPYFYDLLDKNGVVTWSEIPFVGPGGYRGEGFVNQAAFRENGKEQLVEMIRQNYNRPAILFWGLFNELKMTGDNPVAYIKELNALAKLEDPSRITTSATNITGQLNEVTDLICWNQYFGWYGGNPADIGQWADETHRKYPQFKIGVSEYGAGASIFHHEDSLKKPNPNSYWHPEAWQAYFHEEHWKALNERPFVWGTFIWNLFDFGASHRTEGDKAGRNDKGLVTFDRKIKKDAWWFYKASWNTTEPVLYIANKRFMTRTNPNTSIKVYSNLDDVELFVNGQSLGKKKGSNATFQWDNVALKKGENQITVKSMKDKKNYIDECGWWLE